MLSLSCPAMADGYTPYFKACLFRKVIAFHLYGYNGNSAATTGSAKKGGGRLSQWQCLSWYIRDLLNGSLISSRKKVPVRSAPWHCHR